MKLERSFQEQCFRDKLLILGMSLEYFAEEEARVSPNFPPISPDFGSSHVKETVGHDSSPDIGMFHLEGETVGHDSHSSWQNTCAKYSSLIPSSLPLKRERSSFVTCVASDCLQYFLAGLIQKEALHPPEGRWI